MARVLTHNRELRTRTYRESATKPQLIVIGRKGPLKPPRLQLYPDFLSTSLALANFMRSRLPRLSRRAVERAVGLTGTAHANLVGASCRKSGYRHAVDGHGPRIP
jgi:hypothetical protein